MFKDKIFHVRRDGGGWEAGREACVVLVTFGSAEGKAFCRGSGCPRNFPLFFFAAEGGELKRMEREQIPYAWKRGR